MKRLIYALFMSTHTLSVSGASCYIIWGILLHHMGHIVTAMNVWIAKQVSLVHVTVITLIGLYTLIHIIHTYTYYTQCA